MTLIINKTQWRLFKAAGFNMKQFKLQGRIPMADEEPGYCEWCAKPFKKRRSDQRFCSDTCRRKYVAEELKAATRDRKFGYQNKPDDDDDK